MKKMNTTLLVLIIIMLVNALSYGTIIPLLYPYAARFGINPFGLSVLFASFSLAQFISTPILGRLSDRFGRKPVLLLCLFGTSASLVLFAAARSVTVLFLARIIDGITGGNVSVAQAVIADSTEGEERAKAFGLLGASFGFGFLFGPALGGLMSEISITAPFWFASIVGFCGTALGLVLLKETLPKSHRQASNKPLFPVRTLLTAIFAPLTGVVLLISLLGAIAQNAWIIGFQSYTVDVLKSSARDIGLLFSLAGLISIIMQSVGIRFLLEKIKSKKTILTLSLILCTIILIPFYWARSFVSFGVLTVLYIFMLAPQTTMVSALLSERTKAEDQGGILGINQAYLSLGQIIGPLLAGVATGIAVNWVFVISLGLFFVASLVSRGLFVPVKEKLDL